VADNGPIIGNRRFPYPSYGFTPPFIDDVASTPGILPRQSDGGAGPIVSNRRLVYQSWAGPIMAPELFGAVTFDHAEGYAKWAPTYPQPTFRQSRDFHASRVPHSSVGPLIWEYNEVQLGWFVQNADPVRTRRLHPSVTSLSFVRVPFVLEISPAMWWPSYPDQHLRRRQTRPGFIAYTPEAETPTPTVAEWQAKYPDIIWRRRATYYRDQFWAGVLAQEPGFEWIVQHPDQVRGRPSTLLLPQGIVWAPETLPNVEFEVTSWLSTYPDFARKKFDSFYLQTFHHWNTIQDLVDQGGGNGFFIFYRRRRR
jgi:hypothetical protein